MKHIVIAVMFALFTLNNVSAQTKYKEIDDILYVSPNDTSSYRQERCKLDLYYPTDANRPFKTIVWFHGIRALRLSRLTTDSTRELTIHNIQRTLRKPLLG